MDSWPQRPLAHGTSLASPLSLDHPVSKAGVAAQPGFWHVCQASLCSLPHTPGHRWTLDCGHQGCGGSTTGLALRGLWVPGGALPAFPPPSGQAWAPARVPPHSQVGASRGQPCFPARSALLVRPASGVPAACPHSARSRGLASARGSLHPRLCSQDGSSCLELTCSWGRCQETQAVSPGASSVLLRQEEGLQWAGGHWAPAGRVCAQQGWETGLEPGLVKLRPTRQSKGGRQPDWTRERGQARGR